MHWTQFWTSRALQPLEHLTIYRHVIPLRFISKISRTQWRKCSRNVSTEVWRNVSKLINADVVVGCPRKTKINVLVEWIDYNKKKKIELWSSASLLFELLRIAFKSGEIKWLNFNFRGTLTFFKFKAFKHNISTDEQCSARCENEKQNYSWSRYIEKCIIHFIFSACAAHVKHEMALFGLVGDFEMLHINQTVVRYRVMLNAHKASMMINMHSLLMWKPSLVNRKCVWLFHLNSMSTRVACCVRPTRWSHKLNKSKLKFIARRRSSINENVNNSLYALFQSPHRLFNCLVLSVVTKVFVDEQYLWRADW